MLFPRSRVTQPGAINPRAYDRARTRAQGRVNKRGAKGESRAKGTVADRLVELELDAGEGRETGACRRDRRQRG